MMYTSQFRKMYTLMTDFVLQGHILGLFMFRICFYFYVYFSLSFIFCNFDVFLVHFITFLFLNKANY